MNNSPKRAPLAAAIKGGVILGGNSPKVRVRNPLTDNVLLCCYAPCDQEGDDRIRVEIPHEKPRWEGEKLIYIFCSDLCKGAYLSKTRYADRA